MKVSQIIQRIDGRLLSGDEDTQVEDYYIGDFLSRVMGRAPEHSCWLTVMNNVNVAGVAVLANVRAVVLLEGVVPAADLLERMEKEKIALISTGLSAFEAAARLNGREAE